LILGSFIVSISDRKANPGRAATGADVLAHLGQCLSRRL
jgi:hypothetical protein